MTWRKCRVCGDRFKAYKAHYHTCFECWTPNQRTRQESRIVLMPVIDAVTIKAALTLTHPDAHPPERRDRANDVSARLTVALEQTRELERA